MQNVNLKCTHKKPLAKIYSTKNDDQVSWTQSYPHIAVDYLTSLNLPKTAKIIDVGGGTSNFVDALLDLGYNNITVLDISEEALAKSKARLGDRTSQITWIVTDITSFIPNSEFDFWYDRAVFHFLTDDEYVQSYVDIVSNTLVAGGSFLLGTFSENGPLKCSGLDIRQYSTEDMQQTFKDRFIPAKCFKHLHTTPFDTSQEFQFCGFIRK